ncbi:MAG: DUF1571 domain-containing protein [Bacteroidota bacterium]
MTKRLLFIQCAIFLSISTGRAQNALVLAEEMFAASRQIKTLSYVMDKQERIEGKMVKQKSFIKVRRNPFQVYAKQLNPNEGLEVLYKEGDRTALINPSGFPWFNVRLEPTSPRMTRDQHHTILDSGFDCFLDVLESLFQKYDSELDHMAAVTGDEIVNGRDCWILEFNNPNFSFVKFVPEKNISLVDLVKKRKISREMIQRYNAGLDSSSELKAGEHFTIPNDYCPRMVLSVDKATKTPMKIQVYDPEGLYQHYEFSEVEIDPQFAANEFESSYVEYDF